MHHKRLMTHAKFIVTSGRIVFGEDAEVRACHGTSPSISADRTGITGEGACTSPVLRTECRDRSEDSLGEILLPLINKDLPTLYALLLQNTSLEPGVVFHFLSHFIFVFSIED